MVPPGHGDYVDPKLLSAAAAQLRGRAAGLPTVSIQGIAGNTKSTRTSILSHLFRFVLETALIYSFFISPWLGLFPKSCSRACLRAL